MQATTGDRLWAVLAHLSGCLWVLCIPFGGTIAATVIYMTKRHASPLVVDQTRESQNFQNTVSLAVIVVVVLVGVAVERLSVAHATEPALAVIALGAISLAAIMTVNVILSIAAAATVLRGGAFHYPFSVKFVRGASDPTTAR